MPITSNLDIGKTNTNLSIKQSTTFKRPAKTLPTSISTNTKCTYSSRTKASISSRQTPPLQPNPIHFLPFSSHSRIANSPTIISISTFKEINLPQNDIISISISINTTIIIERAAPSMIAKPFPQCRTPARGLRPAKIRQHMTPR